MDTTLSKLSSCQSQTALQSIVFMITWTVINLLTTTTYFFYIKFICSEKATKFWEIFPLLLTTVHTVKSKGKISQNFVAFSEYMNFTIPITFWNLNHYSFRVKLDLYILVEMAQNIGLHEIQAILNEIDSKLK